MKRSVAICGAVLLLASQVWGQRAQLGLRGRVREPGKPTPKEPIRRLPRRAPADLTITPVSPLDRYIEEQLARQKSAPLSEDRLRPLVRPVPGAALSGSPPSPVDRLPHRTDVAAVLAGWPPPFVMPQNEPAEPVPTRWRIGFPMWQRYANRGLDTGLNKGTRNRVVTSSALTDDTARMLNQARGCSNLAARSFSVSIEISTIGCPFSHA